MLQTSKDGQNGDFLPTTFQSTCSLESLPSFTVWKIDWQQLSNPLTRKTYFRTITQCTEASNHNTLGEIHYIIFELLILSTIAIL